MSLANIAMSKSDDNQHDDDGAPHTDVAPAVQADTLLAAATHDAAPEAI